MLKLQCNFYTTYYTSIQNEWNEYEWNTICWKKYIFTYLNEHSALCPTKNEEISLNIKYT